MLFKKNGIFYDEQDMFREICSANPDCGECRLGEISYHECEDLIRSDPSRVAREFGFQLIEEN